MRVGVVARVLIAVAFIVLAGNIVVLATPAPSAAWGCYANCVGGQNDLECISTRPGSPCSAADQYYDEEEGWFNGHCTGWTYNNEEEQWEYTYQTCEEPPLPPI